MTDPLHPPADTALAGRRAFLTGAALIGAGVLTGCATRSATTGLRIATAAAPRQPTPVPAGALPAEPPALLARGDAPRGVRADLYRRALAAMEWHGTRIPARDRIVIADFTPGSARPRLQLINLEDGKVRELLVAHGIGSDPGHSGFLQRFSNVPDSECTSAGTYVTRDYYVGQHGHSQRLMGLDPTNNLAFERAIVIHAAWYANADMIEKHGKLGRSQGCFAVGETELANLFGALGEGRMIYAGKSVLA
ncbi:murein L,D-transpeptidase catalytic domain family protein [Sphingomonas sp. BGYR3]|uniref:murein L,D-transpeptidase catalytic domain family protein n=1 Tax=Sphingomonas sp. BGYR3 TaxID=2975483 RepID=UPI0021A61F78|nr:murein L,D-transpeptidase catalytic domain family protein [Sphingomonas sp. BGYR3]MDG5487395.1 murein L,D-transpeptidase catalytic domain family protein [Sphingomonas sp. BGYR3]